MFRETIEYLLNIRYVNICFVRIFSIPLPLDVKINTPIT